MSASAADMPPRAGFADGIDESGVEESGAELEATIFGCLKTAPAISASSSSPTSAPPAMTKIRLGPVRIAGRPPADAAAVGAVVSVGALGLRMAAAAM